MALPKRPTYTPYTNTANEADFLGEGTLAPPVSASSDRTPEQIAADQQAANAQTNLANAAQVNAIHAAPGGFVSDKQTNLEEGAAIQAADAKNRPSYSRSGIDLPFIGDIPGVGPIAEGAFEAAQKGPLGAGEYILEHPKESLLTAGIAPAIAGGDAAADSLATGVVRGVTGNKDAVANLPLTPAQLYDPNGPLYDPVNPDGSGQINIPGIKDIGEGAINLAGDAGDAIGDFFGGFGGGGAPGGGGDFFGGFGGGGAPGGGGAGTGPGAEMAYNAIADVNQQQDFAQQLGLGVLGGSVAGPDAGAKGLQEQELARAQGFAPGTTRGVLGEFGGLQNAPKAAAGTMGEISQFQTGPRAATDVMGDVDTFLGAPKGPSAAEIQLKQAQDDSMSDALSLARSARGGAGATNRALRVAMAENAATQSGGARDMALLRAKEEEARRDETLRGLGLKGELAGGVDTGTLGALSTKAGLASGLDQNALSTLTAKGGLAQGVDQQTLDSLGLSSGLATDIRTGGIQERGDTLQAGTGLVGDVLGSATETAKSTIPAYLQNELGYSELGYELTPQQKLQLAALGAGGDILSTFF